MTGNLTDKFTLFFTVLMATAGFSVAEQKKEKRKAWYTDIEIAKKVAQKEGKDILIEFTRSEGCGWCLKLEKEVLFQPKFQEQMPKSYVMVYLNYPHDDSKWSSETKEELEKLSKYYRVRKFPYLVFADATGRPFEGESYRDRKPEEYFEEIVGVQKQRTKRDSSFAAAKKAEGVKKARLLEKGLSEVSRKYHRYYPEIIDQIAKADPNDTSGFVSKARVDQVRSHLDRKLKTYYEEKNYSAIPELIDNYVSEHKPSAEALQTAMLYKLQALHTTKQYAEAKTLADEVIAINNVSRASRYANSFKKRIERIEKEESEEKAAAAIE